VGSGPTYPEKALGLAKEKKRKEKLGKKKRRKR
jgi:hypothetical protein